MNWRYCSLALGHRGSQDTSAKYLKTHQTDGMDVHTDGRTDTDQCYGHIWLHRWDQIDLAHTAPLLLQCKYTVHVPLHWSGPCLNIKTVFPRYGDSHVKDKMVTRPSCLVHPVSYTWVYKTSAGCLRLIYPSLGMRQLLGDVTMGQWRHN